MTPEDKKVGYLNQNSNWYSTQYNDFIKWIKIKSQNKIGNISF